MHSRISTDKCPGLSKSYKGKFPFKIGTTSYIHPADIITNVQAIGGYVDEIELLFFQSIPDDVLPSDDDMEKLIDLGKTLDLTYNVHLPTDVSICDPEPQASVALERITRVIELTRPLNPSTFTLHLPCDIERTPESIHRWQRRIRNNLKSLLAGIPGRNLSVENLNFPLPWLESIINDLDLSVCMDVGHLVRDGYDIKETFFRFQDRICIMHLHGVENGKDHVPVSRFDPLYARQVMEVLSLFQGVVSLEIFSYENLMESLGFLENTKLYKI